MSAPTFTFTRNPTTKVSVQIETSGLVKADNELVLIGRMAASGSTATAGVPYQIQNFGDPVAALAECVAIFGASAEISSMVVAAISAVFYGNAVSKLFPTIKVIPVVSTAVSSDLASTLAANIGLPMPFSAIPYPVTDATALSAYKAHLGAISGDDRGDNGQFGSFGTMASKDTLSNTTTAGLSAASQLIMVPWLRDAGTANTIPQIAAAYAATCASVGQPFLPLNDRIIGGLVVPVAVADWHTSGDTGTIALGLDSGVVPLYSTNSGDVKVSRSITSYRPISASAATSYYDFQDWKTIYYYRQNAYLLSKQPRYAIAKASDQTLLALRSELIGIAKDFETLGMFQHVDQLVSQFTCIRPLYNRFAGVYAIPMNVVPGFMQKGIGLIGTTQFDTFQLA